jgi:phosphatidylserine decarboxylase
MSIQLVIQVSAENSHTFEVPFNCSIHEIKHQIAQIFNIQRDKFKLVNDGIALPDHLTLEQCSIKDFSRFTVMRSDSYIVTVHKAFRDERTSVIVNPKDSVLAIKNKLAKKENTSVDLITLTHRGLSIENHLTAKECGIEENSVLVMYVEPRFF